MIDAGLCHGAAGNGHLFHRLYRATGEPRLSAAARAWYGQALEYRQEGQGLAGFISWGMVPETEQGGWIASPGLLEGLAGIGLALLAATTSVTPEWDRLLLVSS